jgi:cytochrome c6
MQAFTINRSAVLGLVSAAAVAIGAFGGSAGANSTGSAAKPAPVSAAAGKIVFKANCGSCHTLADAKTSGNVGPNLDKLKPKMALVVKQVTKGGGGMPAFGGRLTKNKIQSVAKYVSSVAGKKKSAPVNGGAP